MDKVETDRYIARDISWLSFNYRVLLEAKDARVPLLERLRFLAIYSSNLDEFFRVRVADIRSLIRIDKKKINKSIDIKPKKILKLINKEVNRQLDIYGQILRTELLPALEKEGIVIYSDQQLCKEHTEEADYYFRTNVMAYLQPYVEGVSKREAFLMNQALYLSVKLKDRRTDKAHFGYVNIPSQHLSRFYALSRLNDHHAFVMIDDIIKLQLGKIYPEYKIEECRAIKLNKDADLHIEDEYSGDLVDKIRNQIEKRDLGIPSRFLYDKAMSTDMLKWLITKFNLHEDDLIPGGSAHNLNDYFQISNPIGAHLEYPFFKSLPHPVLKHKKSLLGAIDESDHMLHFPYQSYDYILQFFNEAAIDPKVIEINVAFYRMAANSLIGESLVSAALNGKQVMVFMEVKARFDEENNLRWAKRFQDVGVKVIYSMPGLKVHAKIALVIKRGKADKKQRYAFFGTGNLNEKTAKIYSDHGLLTSNAALAAELEGVFKFLYKRVQPKPFKELLVSQFNMMERFIELIDFEIAEATQGRAAAMTIKLNNLEEKTMIDKLYEASQAGVKIEMIIRGICCLRPGVKGMSDNISIRRIVDRYLEHARAFIFHHAGEDLLFLGSADWMNRNLHSRVEVSFPVRDKRAKEEIQKIIQFQLTDNCKASQINRRSENIRINKESGDDIRAQFDTYEYISELE